MRSIGVFARWPELGRVKTRLVPPLAPERALELHEAMLRDSLEAGARCRADRRLVFWADRPAGAGRDLPGWEERDQQGTGLGARLTAAFEELLRGGGPAVVIGCDAPEITAERIDSALEALRERPLAIGPAPDGGYFLIGLARPVPRLFERIDWSTGRVLEQTLARARGLGLAWTALEPLPDIDTASDLAALAERCAARPASAPHTARTLSAWG